MFPPPPPHSPPSSVLNDAAPCLQRYNDEMRAECESRCELGGHLRALGTRGDPGGKKLQLTGAPDGGPQLALPEIAPLCK